MYKRQREHNAARVGPRRPPPRLGLDRDHAVPRAANGQERRIVLHRQPEDPTVPAQVIHPMRARHAINGVPRLLPEAGDVIALDRQGRIAKLGTDQEFRRAQSAHAGKGFPRPLVTRRIAIEAQDIGDAFADQAVGDSEAGLAAADDQDVVDMLATRMRSRLDPRGCRISEHIELMADACSQARQAVGGVRHLKAPIAKGSAPMERAAQPAFLHLRMSLSENRGPLFRDMR